MDNDSQNFEISEEEFDSFLEMLQMPDGYKPAVEIFAIGGEGTSSTSNSSQTSTESPPTDWAAVYNAQIVDDVMLGMTIGSIERTKEIKTEMVKPVLDMYIKKLDESNIIADDIIEIVLLCKNMRNELDLHSIIHKIEEKIFINDVSTQLKDNIKSHKTSIYLPFHILRAYLRAEQNKWEEAQKIWDELGEEWISKVPNKQTHLLFHLFVTHLCTGQWDKSLEYFDLLWTITKSMNMADRHTNSAFDDLSCALLVLWFFNVNIPEFYSKFKSKTKMRDTNYRGQKKTVLLKHIDKRVFVDLLSPTYYNKAKDLYPELPEINN